MIAPVPGAEDGMSATRTVAELPDRSAGVLVREELDYGGGSVEMLVGGRGVPLVLLHGLDGGICWDSYLRGLAEDFTLYVPSHPGFNGSSRPEWMATMADMAAWYTWFLAELPARVAVVGHSIGGWLAAEIAVRGSGVDRLVLVDAMGLEPPEGEIADVFMLTTDEYSARAFANPDARDRFVGALESGLTARWMMDRNLEMSSRIGWKPYMVDPALHGLLPRFPAPVQVIWGADDGIVPVGCGRRYAELLPRATLSVVPSAGHHPHEDQPEAVVKIVKEFLL
jgi:pimeloyl-ACP methyl ester carboxylesterase